MEYSSGLVSTPVSLKGVAELVGASFDVGSVCTANGINKWAKYKPIRNSEKFLFGSDFETAIVNANYGIDVSNIEEDTEAIVLASAGDFMWDYLKPYGKQLTPWTPYRLGDFVKYYRDAVCPINIGMLDEVTEMSGTVAYVALALDDEITGFSSEYNVPSKGFLRQYNDNYCLTAVVSQNDVVKKYYYASTMWSTDNSNSWRVNMDDIDNLGLKYGTFRVDVMLTDYDISTDTGGDKAISLEAYEGASHRDITYKADTVLSTISASMFAIYMQSGSASGGYVTWNIGNIDFRVSIPQFSTFKSRYIDKRQDTGTAQVWANWKMQMYVVDAKDASGNYHTNEWIDISDWSNIDDYLGEDEVVSLGLMSDYAEIFYGDYDGTSENTHQFKIRILLKVHDYKSGEREFELGEYTFDVPVKGGIIDINA